jgi:hypothetical protein
MEIETLRLAPEQKACEHGPTFTEVDVKRDLYRCAECGAVLCLPDLTEYRKFCGATQ